MPRKLLVVQAAALSAEMSARLPGRAFHSARAEFPAVTCSAQAAFRTAAPASQHGMVGNGLWFPELRKVLFWEQAAALVSGPRIWKKYRAGGGRVGLMFWQQSLGESADLILSPTPIHKHSGGMIQDCYSHPRDLYPRLIEAVGRPFNLMNYWGPLASRRSTEWIVDATCAVLAMPDAPGLLFTYLPHLDYDLQRRGPDSPQAARAVAELATWLTRLRESATAHGYEILVWGDYAIEQVSGGAVFPNRALREAGLFATREIRGMRYADFFATGAFAVVDHQVAHVHAAEEKAAAEVLRALPGVERVLDRAAQREFGIDHARSGDLVLIAQPGHWFAYPWWSERAEAPDFASHVDIHNKPGYDPCELFFGFPPLGVSSDPTRIHGTHGRPGESIGWSTTLPFEREPATQLELAHAVRTWLERND